MTDEQTSQPRRSMRTAGVAAGLRFSAAVSPFTEKELLGLRSVVPAGGVCFDIGAAYGMYTFPLARLVGESGTVHSFEPLAGSYRVLSLARRLVGGTNIRLYQSAVSGEGGSQRLNVPHQWGFPIRGRAFLTRGAAGLGANATFGSYREVSVPVTTVDEECRRAGIGRVDFVKVDVEGAELAVIEGARDTIDAFSPSLLLEIEDRHLGKYGFTGREVMDRLIRRGYRMYVWSGRRWTESFAVTAGHRNYLFSTSLDRQPVPAGRRLVRPAVPAR